MTPLTLRDNVVYCPKGSCDNNQSNICKTKSHFTLRVQEHLSRKSAFHEHISSCKDCHSCLFYIYIFYISYIYILYYIYIYIFLYFTSSQHRLSCQNKGISIYRQSVTEKTTTKYIIMVLHFSSICLKICNVLNRYTGYSLAS